MDERIVPSDAEFWTRAQRHLLKYGGEFVDFVPVRAEGAFLYDEAGRRVLDVTSGQMSAVLGHSHPEIVATVRDGIGRLDHPFSSMLSPACGRSRRGLAQLVPVLPRQEPKVRIHLPPARSHVRTRLLMRHFGPRAGPSTLRTHLTPIRGASTPTIELRL
jgi:4-aminobutyrate aminotransferase-like enzyme